MEKLKSTKNQNQHIAGIVESGFGKNETTATTTGRKSSSKVNKNNNNNNNSASENRRNNSSNSYSNHNISVSAITTRSSSFRSSTIAKRAKTEISTSTNNNSNVNSFMKSDKCSKYGGSSGGGSSDVKPKTSNRRKQKGTTAHKKSDDDDERIAESSETIITVGKLEPETHEDKCEESSVGKVDEFDGDPDVSSDTEDNDNNEDDKKKDWGNEKESMVNPTSLISVNSNNNNNLKLAEPPQPSSICPTTTTSSSSSSSGGSNSVLTTSLRSKSNLNSNWNFRPTTVSASTISESQHQAQAHQSGGVVGEGSDCDMTTTTTTTTTTSMGVELKSQIIPQSVVHMIKNERTSPSPSSSSGSSSPVPSLSAYPLITSAALAFVESQQILLPNLHSKPSGNSSHQSHFASNNNESHKKSHGLRHSNNNNSNLNVKTSSMAASVSTNANGPTTTPSSANKNKHGSSNNNNNNNNPEPSKIAPQNLMNNLPYMGELTFDTRPRRGRKPKKADICHLISKNYGIHFPNSYVNIPSSFPTPRVPVPNPVSTGPSARDSTSRGVNSGSRGAKNKSSSRSASARQQQNPNNNSSHHAINKNISSSTQQSQFTFSSVDPSSLPHTNLSSSSSSNHERHRRHNNNSTSNNRRSHNPPNPKEASSLNDDMANDEDDGNGIINTHLLPNWTHHVPPDLLPLASLNPEALFQHHQLHHQQQQQQINSKNPPGPGSGPGPGQSVGKKKTLGRSQQQSFPRDTVRSQNQDEPLNLCVRDKESSHLNHLNLLSATASINNMYSSTSGSSPHPHPASGNVGKPSANNLFNNFNLRLNAASKNLFSTSPQQLGHGHGGHHGKSLNPKSQQVHNTVNKRGSSSSSSATYQFESSNNTNTDHSNIVSDDPNLVNLNLQLNLCASKLTNSANNNNNNNSNSNRPMHSASSTVGNNIDSSMRANNNNHINNSNNHNNRALTAPLPLGGNNNNNGTTGKNPKGRRKRGSNFPANNSVSSSAAASSGNVHPSYSHNSNSLYNLNCTPSNMMSHQQQSSSHFNPNHHSMQSDNTNNPVEINISPFASSPSNPAEVSICKFKFTGGAKPSLQEKKMLSVDSGGNFRFYSDKACSSSAQSKNSSNNHHSNHMYHHQGSFKDDQNSSGELISNSHGLPKSAKSMSMCMPVPIPSMSTCSVISEIQQSPSLPSMASPGELDCSSSSDGGTSGTSLLPSPTGMMSSAGQYDPCGSGTGSSSNNKIKMNKRKRRTRKSLMREKLEKTFKEKGFLIQTQQLESAEGATYCKFRQLRKFTRYLFRSWKDYLPDNLKGINPAVAGQAHMEANALGLQGMSSDNLSEGGMDHGMELEQDGDDSEDCGSDSPDNLTLSPAETHGDQDNDQQDPDDDDDEMVDDT